MKMANHCTLKESVQTGNDVGLCPCIMLFPNVMHAQYLIHPNDELAGMRRVR